MSEPRGEVDRRSSGVDLVAVRAEVAEGCPCHFRADEEIEPTLDLLEELLAMAAGQWISVARIEADPRFDTLRHHPRYRKLVASR